MGLKEFVHRLVHRDEELSQAEKELKIQKIVNARQKNSNERELDRFLEEERQENIKLQLEDFRKKRQHDMWVTKLADTSNMFTAKSTMLNNDHSVLKNSGDSNFGKGNMLSGGWGW